jgi:TolA-binding protein
MKDKAAARQTLTNLIKRFPASSAAKAGKERLAELK